MANVNVKEGPQTIHLTTAAMQKFKPARVFKGAVEEAPGGRGPPRHITGLAFDNKGEVCLTAAEDESYRLYSCKTGKHQKTLYSKKYGIDLPRFTHSRNTVVYASTKEDDTIRYASLHDNKYLQYFKGHTKKVISLEMSPLDDTFLSSSLDNTVRLWDLRTPNCRGLLTTPTAPIVAYETSGAVFAVGFNGYNRINLYDFNNFDKAPFITITLEDVALKEISYPPKSPYMTSISFSGNAKYILVGTSGDGHYVLDAYDGNMILKLEGHKGLERGKQPGAEPSIIPHKGISGEEVCWTPDSKFVVGGSHDGKILVWDLSDERILHKVPPGGRVPKLEPCASLDGHPGPSRCVRFNPKWAMLATAGAELAFWLPDPTGGDADFDTKKILGRLGLS